MLSPGLLAYQADLFDIPVHGKLSPESLRIHVSYHAEYLTLTPRAIVFAKAPCDSGVPVGIPSVNLIFIIEMQGD
jgi:hypothetical protein